MSKAKPKLKWEQAEDGSHRLVVHIGPLRFSLQQLGKVEGKREVCYYILYRGGTSSWNRIGDFRTLDLAMEQVRKESLDSIKAIKKALKE